jgi:hypothetical protein
MKLKWLGIVVLFLAPFGYMALMRSSGEPIEWFVVGFIWAMAVAMVLFATVFKKRLEDTPENRELALKVI